MNESDKKAFNDVQTKQSDTESKLSSTFKRWNELEDLYFFHTPQNKKSTKSNVFDPMAYEQVEHVTSHLYTGDPRGEFVPMESGDEINTDAMNELWKYQWTLPQANMRKKIINTGRRKLIYGAAYGIVNWRYERIFDKNLNKWRTNWDDWCYYDLNPYDCYPDLDAQTPKDMEYFIYDEYIPFRILEAQNSFKVNGKNRYKNLDELKKLLNDKDPSASVDNQYRNNMLTRRKLDNGKQMEGRIKVRRFLSPDRWITILPDYNLTIEDNPNPHNNMEMNVVMDIDQDIPGIILGIGEIDPVRSLLTSINQTINLRLDNVKMYLERPMKALKSEMNNSKTWKWGRNNIFELNTMNGLEPFDIQDVTGNTFVNTLQTLQGIVKERSGRSDVLTMNKSNKSATEIDAMVNEQNARLNYKLQNTEDFIKDISIKGMQLNQQYLKKDKFIRIVGADNIARLQQKFGNDSSRLQVKSDGVGFLRVSPDDIRGTFDFMVESGSTQMANNSKEIQNLGTVLQLLGQYAQVYQQQGKTVDPTPILEKMMTKLGVKNIDSIIKAAPTYGQTPNGDPLSALMQGGVSGASGLSQGTTEPSAQQFGNMQG